MNFCTYLSNFQISISRPFYPPQFLPFNYVFGPREKPLAQLQLHMQIVNQNTDKTDNNVNRNREFYNQN